MNALIRPPGTLSHKEEGKLLCRLNIMHRHHNNERQITLILSTILSFRLMGLFMLFPVLSPYAKALPGSTPLLLGIAIGIYGLTQTLLQIPFGYCSDHYGRKQIITVGLIIFAIGSAIAATTDSILGLIIGRALQGAGAIGSSLIALLTDLIREQNRTKAMAVTGMVIGASFSISMILGPLLNSWFQVQGIFIATVFLALLGILLLHLFVPSPARLRLPLDIPIRKQLHQLITNSKLFSLYLSIFLLHVILTSNFVVIPLFLQSVINLHHHPEWMFYAVVFLVAILLTIPLLIAERKFHSSSIFIFSIALLILAESILFLFHQDEVFLVISLIVFFVGFNFLEAYLPSLISKFAPIHNKGAALGIYSSCQFLGIFIGGVSGGWVYGHVGAFSIFLICAIIAFVWLLIITNIWKFKHT